MANLFQSPVRDRLNQVFDCGRKLSGLVERFQISLVARQGGELHDLPYRLLFALPFSGKNAALFQVCVSDSS